MTNTLWFALLALVFGYPLPLAAAVLMSEVRRTRGLFSALAYLPVVVPPVVAVLLWKFFYDPRPTGVFNTIAGWVGLGPYPGSRTRTPPCRPWYWRRPGRRPAGPSSSTSPRSSAVPTELYEAAEVDGAGVWRKIWHVTLPQLRGVLFITLILQVIGTSQVFLEPFLFTGGGPNNATLTILMLIYDYAFGSSLGGNYGAATALSLMLAGVLAVLSAIYFRVTRPWSTHGANNRHDGARPAGARTRHRSAASCRRTTGAGRRRRAAPACGRSLGGAAAGPRRCWSSSSSGSGRSSGSRRPPSPRRRTPCASPSGCSPTGSTGPTSRTAWTAPRSSHYFVNTVIVAVGAWFFQLLVATTGGYVLSVLRPRYSNVTSAWCWRRSSCRPSCCSCRCT